MSLWKKVRELEGPSLAEIVSMYGAQQIPIEVRDYFSIWIESSIRHLEPAGFASGLSSQIQEKLGSMSLLTQEDGMGLGAATPFYVIQKLVQFQVTLNSSQSERVQDLHSRFLTCLETEKAIANGQAVGSSSCSSSLSNANATEPSLTTPKPQMTGQGNYFDFKNEQSPAINTDCPQYSSSEDIAETEAISDIEPYNPEEFLSNFVRISLDGDMSHIFDVVWGLEESSNLFSIKCHELRRFQELAEQQTRFKSINGMQQQSFEEFQETQTKIGDTRSEVLGIATDIFGKTNDIRNRSEAVLLNWAQLKTELDGDLAQWAYQQKGWTNGRPMTMTLNKCQHISEYLMDVAWKLRHYLMNTERIRQANLGIFNENNPNGGGGSCSDIPEQITRITGWIKQLVRDTFIIAHQPNQVLKTNTRIHVTPGRSPMEVRLLVGEKLSLQLSPPTVKISLIDENTARDIDMRGLEGELFATVPNKGRLMPDTKQLEFLSEAGTSSAIFRQVSFKEIYRNGRRHNLGKDQGGECVTEEKLCILFRAEFSAGDMHFQVWRKSLPIVVITHGSQESSAWAAVTWDNAFSFMNRITFEVPECVSWDALRDMLSTKFSCMVGSPLREENLNYFKEKLAILEGYPNNISWTDLCKVNFPGRKFTFWDWFYEATKFLEQNLKHAWKRGHVKGFIGKEASERILCHGGCQPGTFLFRFSDSVLGGISIMWLHSDGKAYSQNPFRTKDLACQSLVDRLNQEYLHYVYPNAKKEVALKKYYNEYQSSLEKKDAEQISKPDYIKLRTQLIIDNPNIPRFCLKDKSRSVTGRSTDYSRIQKETFPTQSNVDDSLIGNCDNDNVIELDIDKIIGELTSSPSCYTESSISSPAYSAYSTTSSYHLSPANSTSGAMGDGESSRNMWTGAGTGTSTGGNANVTGGNGSRESSPYPGQVEERFYMEL